MEVDNMVKANINWTAKQISKMMMNGALKFDNVVQRGLAWDVKRKSLLIMSILEGYPIPPFYTIKTEEKVKDNRGREISVYDCLDGKQRCNAIASYINGEFALKGDDLEVEFDGDVLDLTGSYFDDLPEELQDTIKDTGFTFFFFTDITDDEINEMFTRLNNGKPLTNIELSRVRAVDLDTIRQIASHDLFMETLTKNNINKYVNEDIVIKSHIVMTSSEPCLDTKAVRPILENLELSENDVNRLNDVFDRVYDLHQIILEDDTDKKLSKKIAKKLVTRSHLISLTPVIYKSIADGVSEEDLAEFLMEFLSGSPTMSKKYNDNVRDGANHTPQVKARLDACAYAYEKWKERNNIEVA